MVSAASRPDSTAPRIPSPLCGHARPAASPTSSAPASRTRRCASSQTRYACPRQGRDAPRGTSPIDGEKRLEPLGRCRQRVPAEAAEPDVQPVVLPDAPSIAREVAAEIQRRRLRLGREGRARPIRNSATCATTRAPRARDSDGPLSRRATGHRCPPAPTIIGAATRRSRSSGAFPPKARDGRAEAQPRARPPQQVVVEFRAPNADAHRLAVRRLDFPRAPDHPDAKSGERLERPPRRYSSTSSSRSATTCGVSHPAHGLSRGNAARVHRPRTSSPAADQGASARRPRGPSADDENVATVHGISHSQLPRVHGSALLPPRANTTWKSCIDPVVNAACEPARYSRHARTNDSSNIADTRGAAVLEALAPMLERLRVVQPEVLDVGDREPLRFEHALADLAKRRRIRAGKDPLDDPRIERRRPVAADEMQQRAALPRSASGRSRRQARRSRAGRRARACRSTRTRRSRPAPRGSRPR